MLKLAILLAFLAQANAQFLKTNALNLQATALADEEKAAEEEAAAETNLMESAVKAMEEAEKLKVYNEAKDKGEPFAPDGTPIPENQNNGVRKLDSRTPVNFGDPFARENNIGGELDALIANAGFSDEELALIDLIDSGQMNVTDYVFDDIHHSMVFLSVPERNLCGINLEHAADYCGPTCDTALDFCVMGHLYGVTDPSFTNYYDNSMGKYQNWGQCFANVTCTNVDEHDIITESADECKTRKFQNPCKHPCDCLRTASDVSMCHELCIRTDSMGFTLCKLKRKLGEKIREGKIANELSMAESCDFNVYYEHPLMSNSVLTEEQLPGLFETF